jgi:peptide-methionine (R)-S-oxide reductase
MISRRDALLGSAAIAAIAISSGRPPGAAAQAVFEVTRTDAEWRAILTPAQFAVLRLGQTEAPGTSPLLHETRPGLYHCAGCDLAVYSSEHKYDSGTGWLSFWTSLHDAIRTGIDNALNYPRVSAQCRRCGGHLGLIFSDGPRRTAFALFFDRPGKRHAINGSGLNFAPA